MTRFGLFDAVELSETVTLPDGGIAAAGTPGAIVEVLDDGSAYMVELFDGWVKKANAHGALIPADPGDPEAFVETLGVEVVQPQQIRLVKSASETVSVRTQLLRTLDQLPEGLVAEVADFAEFLRQKQQRRALIEDERVL